MKKGFTLIELLAVIIILSILSLIVVPVISGIITDAKKKSAERSTDGFVRAVELAEKNYQLENLGSISQNIEDLSLSDSEKRDVVIYNISISDDGIVTTGNFEINNFICHYENSLSKCENKDLIAGKPAILSKIDNPNGTITITIEDTVGFGLLDFYQSTEDNLLDDVEWIENRNTTFTFTPIDAPNIYVWVKDVLGNVSDAFNITQSIYLYNLGDEKESITGGWDGYIFWEHVDPYDASNKALSYYWQKNADNLEFGDNGSEYGKVTSYGDGAFSPKNKIDFTNYNKMIINYEIKNVHLNTSPYGAHTCAFQIFVSDIEKANTFEENKTSVFSASTSTNVARKTVEVDISTLTGEKYIIMASRDGYQWDDAQSIYVYSILLTN